MIPAEPSISGDPKVFDDESADAKPSVTQRSDLENVSETIIPHCAPLVISDGFAKLTDIERARLRTWGSRSRPSRAHARGCRQA